MIKSKNTNTISVRVSNRMREGIESLALNNEATQSDQAKPNKTTKKNKHTRMHTYHQPPAAHLCVL